MASRQFGLNVEVLNVHRCFISPVTMTLLYNSAGNQPLDLVDCSGFAVLHLVYLRQEAVIQSYCDIQ